MSIFAKVIPGILLIPSITLLTPCIISSTALEFASTARFHNTGNVLIAASIPNAAKRIGPIPVLKSRAAAAASFSPVGNWKINLPAVATSWTNTLNTSERLAVIDLIFSIYSGTFCLMESSLFFSQSLSLSLIPASCCFNAPNAPASATDFCISMT